MFRSSGFQTFEFSEIQIRISKQTTQEKFMNRKKQVAIREEYHQWLRVRAATIGVSQGGIVEGLIKEEQSREKERDKAKTKD
jgi:hypothetical protein